MLRKSFAITTLFCLILSGCQLTREQTPVISNAATIKYAAEAETIIKQTVAPKDAISVNAKEDDLYVRAIETETTNRLQRGGYAVQLVLPENERQKADKNSYQQQGIKILLDYIPYQQSNYAELVVTIDNVRYSRLYMVNGNQPKAVSNWICRTAVLSVE